MPYSKSPPEHQIGYFLETTGMREEMLNLPAWVIVSVRDTGEVSTIRGCTYHFAMTHAKQTKKGFKSHTIAFEFVTFVANE